MKFKKIKNGLVVALLVLALVMGGCANNSSNNSLGQKVEENIQDSSVSDIYSENIDDNSVLTNLDTDKSTETQVGNQEEVIVFDLESLPGYSGSPYIIINGGVPYFSDEEKTSVVPFEAYSELDKYGRCGVAYANICIELMPTEERGTIGQIRPSGWHTVKYNELIEGNYLYNRCHLIGYQLAGENANELNLITGTRYLNVVGMLEFENQVCSYVKETDNHVLYRVTPWFDDANLVANGVQIEAWSVEDAGKGICINVYCYNVQPGIEIDYATGESWESADNNSGDKIDEVNEQDINLIENGTVADEIREYVLNKNTKKFHLPTCSSVEDMSEKNKEIVNSSIDEIKGRGYTPCARCLGEYR